VAHGGDISAHPLTRNVTLNYATAQDSDVIITMGCGDTCPVFLGKRYEDWQLIDPAGQPIEVVRAVRDEIRARVEKLLADLVTADGAA
jgi:arsenate reductase